MQVIQIHIGSAGINIGDVSWDLLRQESNLNPDGSRNQKGDVNQTFFHEIINNRYTARAVFLDTDDSPMNEILQGNNKAFYQSHSMGKQSASTYARGYYTLGKQNLSNAMSVINKQIELCDKLDGFIITHSISGGVGSGLASLIDEELQNNFQKVPKVAITVMPSPDIGNCVIAPYNAILSLNKQIDHQDLTICLDNQQLYKICDNLDIECPNYNTINQLIAQVTSGLAIGYSEPKQMLLTDQITNLIPYQRHHFVQPYIYFTQYNKDNFIKNLYSSSLSSFQKNNAKQISKTMLFRGDITYYELFNQIYNQANDNLIKQVDWSPTNSKIAVSESKILFQEQKIKNGGFMLQNSANIAGQFEKVANDFDKLFAKRSFVFRYYLDGMEEQDFFDSRELTQAFIKDYEDLFVFDQNGEDPDLIEYYD